jgi:hypothetical protein
MSHDGGRHRSGYWLLLSSAQGAPSGARDTTGFSGQGQGARARRSRQPKKREILPAVNCEAPKTRKFDFCLFSVGSSCRARRKKAKKRKNRCRSRLGTSLPRGKKGPQAQAKEQGSKEPAKKKAGDRRPRGPGPPWWVGLGGSEAKKGPGPGQGAPKGKKLKATYIWQMATKWGR